MMMCHNLQTMHSVRLLVNQPGMNAGVLFSCQDWRNTSVWQHANYHKITKLMEGLDSIEVFQNSHQFLHFADFMFDTLLRALSLCPGMYPCTESAWASANDSQQQEQQQVRFPLFLPWRHPSSFCSWGLGDLHIKKTALALV